MAIPVWPAELPQYPLRSGYQRTKPNLLRRSKPEEGPAIVSAKAVLGVDVITWPQIFTTAQRDLLQTFAYSTLRSGALRFALPDPDGGATKLECRIVPASDSALYTEAAIMAKGLHSITLTLEVLP
ncbi:MAG: hypothetical protein AUJ49_08480 [Desulfovibrionaceae bacterium CG1_02_65_16]|nr:MAG: hypothetical protein AUJ49_08480 [Desulfovibrionaceae bacterium CG1_02_65_16]